MLELTSKRRDEAARPPWPLGTLQPDFRRAIQRLRPVERGFRDCDLEDLDQCPIR